MPCLSLPEVSSQVPVFLVYFTAAGGELLAALPLEGTSCIYYLPNAPQDNEIDIASDPDQGHSSLCLEIHSDFVLLRAIDDGDGPCSVLSENGSEFEIPMSTSAHLKSLILRGDEHFLSPAGRWSIRWDDVHRTISNSMRPPPLPVVDGFPVVEDEEDDFKDILLADRENCSTASPGQSRTSTDCPSPVTYNHGKQADFSAEDPGRLRDSLNKSANLSTIEDDDDPEDKDQIFDTSHENQSKEAAEDPQPQSRAQSETSDGAPEWTTGSPEARNPTKEDTISRDAAAASISPTSSELHTTDDVVSMPAPLPDKLTKKRKLLEVEHTDSESEGRHVRSPPEGEDKETDTITVMTESRNKAIVREHNSSNQVSCPTVESPDTLSRPQSRRSGGKTSSGPQRRGKRPARSVWSFTKRPRIVHIPVAIFSNTNMQEQRSMVQCFISLGGCVTSSINDATVLVVGSLPLKKTGKLIMAVALGLDVVTKDWIFDSFEKHRIQDIREYLPNDSCREQEWKFNLKQAIERGRQGLAGLLSGTTVIFTKQFRTDLGNLELELSKIATILGAEAVRHRLPALKDRRKYREKDFLIIGAPHDPQGAQVGRLGQKLFNKDILTMGALRGEIDRESEEFIIKVPVKAEETD